MTSGNQPSTAQRRHVEPPGPAEVLSERIVELGRGLPGWLPRVVLLAAGVGAVLAQAGSGPGWGLLLVLAVFAVLASVFPSSPAPAVLIAAVAVMVTATTGSPLRAEVLVEIPLLHLVHLSAALAGIVPVLARIQPAALRAPGFRFLLVQLVTFGVAGLAALLPTGRNSAQIEVAGLVAVAGLVVLGTRLIGRGR
jgi:hypothetical protein